ncbi:MAG TPA: LacI family DNA-binding transcriptional regulator [Gaiellaceae bacterium]|nr:LacI family DNA-binding transcriptional regulator [Gaiellaceae bacterium]
MTVPRAKTLADIARLAGVSKSTASRALNDSPLIGVDTKDRIRAIAAEHGFAVNEPARRLTTRRSNVVGLVMFDWGIAKRQDIFMLEVMGGVSAGLHEEGYELLILQPRFDDRDWARRYLETGQADGFVFHLAQCSPEQLDRLEQEGVPFAVWGPASPRNAYSSVSGDSVNGGRIATEHLLERGCRRIAMIGGPARAHEVLERSGGYEAALAAVGLAADPQLVEHLPWSAGDSDAGEAVGRLLERAPDLDAIFAHSDRWALGALAELRERGIRVPDDVAVVGYDDIVTAAYAYPPLTTVRQDGDLVGRLLARTLAQQLQTGVVSAVTIPAELVVRESA